MITRILDKIKFLRSIEHDPETFIDFVMDAGLEPKKIGKKIGQGIQHNIFLYGNGDYVVKIPKFTFMGFFLGVFTFIEADQDAEFIKKHFPDLYIDTKVLYANRFKSYIIYQETVKKYEYLNSENIYEIKDQFKPFWDKNKSLYKRYSRSIDFWGGEGIIKSIQSSVRRIKPFWLLTNMVVIKEGGEKKIKIIDTNLMRSKDKVYPFRVIIERFIFFITEIVFKILKYI